MLALKNERGDTQCREAVNTLLKIKKCALRVIGADTNANPEVYEGTAYENRFQFLERMGFQTHRTKQPTNVNPRATQQKEREIDFVFTQEMRPTLWQRVQSIFWSSTKNSIEILDKKPLSIDQQTPWNPEKNASDHIPVFARIRYVQQESLLARLCAAVLTPFTFLKGLGRVSS